MESISTHNLNYSIGNKQILKDINLQVPKGSIYGYLGKNGAGKSTTIKLLLGLLQEKEDNIYIQNLSLKHESIKIHSITGNLIEAPCFYTRLTVYENLKYLDIIYGRGRKKIEEALELVDLTKEKHKKASALSMGMKQRLGIAIAIFNDPEILILDEPLNGLDPQGIVEMRKLFINLNQQGKTIFLSSHILSELEKTATHIGIINNGSMIFQGKKKDLFKEVRRSYTLSVNQPEIASEILIKNGYTIVNTDKHTLSVNVNQGNEFNLLVNTLVHNHIEVNDITSKNIDLEEVFMNLISKNDD